MLKSLGERRSTRKSERSNKYRYVMHAAVAMLQKNINVQLGMLLHSIKYCISIDTNNQLFNGLFSWSNKVFLERRSNVNKMTMEMILLEDSHQLDIYKLNCDLNETLKFINLLFDALFRVMSDTKFNIDKQLWEPLRDIEELIKTEEHIENLIKDPTVVFLLIYQKFIPIFTYVEHKRLRKYINFMNDMRVINNTELRYNLSWQDAKVTQAELQTENNLSELKATIERQKLFSFIEEDCGDSTVEVIYNNAEKYRDMLERFEYDFHKKDDMWTEIVKVKRSAHEKLLHQLNFYKEQFAWFNDEMQRVELMIQNGQAEREAYRKQQEELRQQAAHTQHTHHLKKHRSLRFNKSRGNLSHASYISGASHIPSEYSRMTVQRLQTSKSTEQGKHSMEGSATHMDDYKPQVRIQEVASEIQRISDISHQIDDEDIHEQTTKRHSKGRRTSHKNIVIKQHSNEIHGESNDELQKKTPLHKKSTLNHKTSVQQKSSMHQKALTHHKVVTHKKKGTKHANEEHNGSSEESLRSHGSANTNIYMSESKEALHQAESRHDGTNETNHTNLESEG